MMSNKRHKSYKLSLSRLAAGVASMAMLATSGLGLAFAAGEGDHNEGTGGANVSTNIMWKYKDDGSGSYGSANDPQSVVNAFNAAGVTIKLNGMQAIRDTLERARVKCATGFMARHPGEGDGECRVVGVGAATYAADNSYDEHITWSGRAQWETGYNTLVKPYEYNYGGQLKYRTSYPFDDDPSRSVDSIAYSLMPNSNGTDKTNLIVIVLDKYQPAPRTYDLSVSTTQQSPAKLQVGDNGAVHDMIHASNSGSPIRERLNAKVILHADLPQGSYVTPVQPVTKTVQIANQGDTRSPDFVPADFGWTYWPEGTYWFDVQVNQQGSMSRGFDATDRDPAETFKVTSTPPAPPHKTISKGVSADSMVNTTRIVSSTGVGGFEMRFTDTISPNGVDYTVNNMKVHDLTANKDVSEQFAMNWQDNTVSAYRPSTHGLLPREHDFEFSFDITVSTPQGYKNVQDEGQVAWNHNPAVETESREFPTWQPNPDKSWVRWDSKTKQWSAVIDPTRSNATGADRMVFLDGDKVGVVVNGTLPAHLAQAPDRIVLTDSYANADYIWDPAVAGKMRVFEAASSTDRHSSVTDIINTGKDVSDQWTLSLDKKSRTITATSSKAYAKAQQNLPTAKQLTVLVPGVANFAYGKGASQVRADFGKAEGEELTFCANPGEGVNPADATLTNAGSQTVNNHTVATNEPYICGYVPPVKKDVLSEASQGGDQESVDGKVVYPGQKVEYRLETQPQLPQNLGYTVESVVITDTYDQYLVADKQTVEVTDLNTARMISKREYTTKWNDAQHQFVLTFNKDYVAKNWANGANPRLLVRFEGTVSKDAPAKRTVDNRWELTLNNSITPSNTVVNTPPEEEPHKADKSVKDASVSIDGKTLLVGERGLYQLTLDARQDNTAYKVWRLGMTDDFDERYVAINPQDITILSDTGKDVTDQMNIQIKDGVAYIYAKTVDTEIPATGELVKGDPQPADLAAYANPDRTYDPLHEPAIDQSLLGHRYTINMPYTVIAGGHGTVVENTALQITNDVKKQTETVKNPVEVINPKKDVTVKVGGESVDSKAIYLDSTFLYQLDSSVIPANRAYPEVAQWGIDDQLDPTYDQLTGQWAVYAARDLYKDGQVIAAQGEKIAGSNFDSTKFGGDLFTATLDPATGKVNIQATPAYLKLVSVDTAHEQAWRAYIQVKRLKVTERHENQFTEQVGDKELTSNIVWTYTPDLTPSLHVEKYDVQTGEMLGDRDDVSQALQIHGESLEIAFKITNTSKTDSKTGKGAFFQAKSLKLDDQTIAGVGKVEDLKYPEEWDSLVLAPGESTVVTGTLKGVNAGDKHTDRVKVTGTPLVECPVSDEHPFDNADSGQTSGNESNESIDADRVTVQLDGKDVTLCKSTDVESNTDDWSGYKQSLAQTGAQIASLMLIATVGLLLGGFGMFAVRRRNRARHIA